MTQVKMQKSCFPQSGRHKMLDRSRIIASADTFDFLEDALIRLDQLHKNLASKQNFLSNLNSKIQAKFDDEATLEDDLL